MALQGSYTDPFGEAHAAAYHRIHDVRPNIDISGLAGVRIGVTVWRDAALRASGGRAYEVFEIPVRSDKLVSYFQTAMNDATLSAFGAVWTAAYAYLKSEEPRFNGMLDA